jgi:hypothetical protein
MKQKPARTELRIVHQARSPRAKVYHLACNEGRLKLDVAEIHDGPVEARWRVVATGRERASDEDAVAAADGATRTDALRGAARAWREQVHVAFDWEAVEALLAEVNAL